MLVRALIVGLLAALLFGQPTLPTPTPGCTPDEVPLGQALNATDLQRPAWCYTLPAPDAQSAIIGANSWVDGFGHPLAGFIDRDIGYRVFAFSSSGRIEIGSFLSETEFASDLVDTSAFRLSGGIQHSPDKSFTFANGVLVVEAQFPAGNWNTGGADVFYEIDISPARPTGITVDPLYGYGTFGGAGAEGCRFQMELVGGVRQGETVCARYDDSHRDAGGTDVTGGPSGLPGRLWETQGGGSPHATTNVQNDPTGHWRACAAGADYGDCLDQFRMEISKDFLRVYVNGFLQRDLEGITTTNDGRDATLPDSWLSGGVYVYFTDWINGGQHHTNRFFWGPLAINAAPTTPAPQPTTSPTAVPTATPAPTVGCRVSVELNGTPGPYKAC